MNNNNNNNKQWSIAAAADGSMVVPVKRWVRPEHGSVPGSASEWVRRRLDG